MSDHRKSDEPEDPQAAQPESPETEAEPAAESDTDQRIAELEAEVVDLRNRLLREMAEMENLRKRTRRETEDAGRYAITRFARDLLTVGDDMQRALESVTDEVREAADDALKNVLAGVEMTGRQLEQALERHGVTKFDPAGQKFDPSVHEAMFEVPDPSQPAGTVAHVVEPGFMIGDRVLRPARVGVSKGGPKVVPQPEPEAAAEAAAQPESAPAEDKPAPEPDQPATEDPKADPAAQDSGYADPAKPEAAAPDERIGLKIDKSA